MPRHPDLTQNMVFVFGGFFFVIFMLGLLAVVTSSVGIAFKRKKPAPASAPVQSSLYSGESAASTEEDQADSDVPFVIAAAVHTVLGGRPHRIMNVRKKNDGWAQEGRRQIFSSHKVR